MASFLTARNQFVKIGEERSFTRAINRSIVQGSGIRPTLFTICIIDLQPLDATNHIYKYADDSSLLIPEKCDIDISEELENVLKWANENKLKINFAMTKELIS